MARPVNILAWTLMASLLWTSSGSMTARADFNSTYKQAMTLYKQEDYEQALRFFHQAAQENKKDANARYYLANCYFVLDYKQEALETYWSVVALFPNSQQAQSALAFLERTAPEFLKTRKYIDSKKKTDQKEKKKAQAKNPQPASTAP